jgi:hypothetical protein
VSNREAVAVALMRILATGATEALGESDCSTPTGFEWPKSWNLRTTTFEFPRGFGI